jgi:hypothetical protein
MNTPTTPIEPDAILHRIYEAIRSLESRMRALERAEEMRNQQQARHELNTILSRTPTPTMGMGKFDTRPNTPIARHESDVELNELPRGYRTAPER